MQTSRRRRGERSPASNLRGWRRPALVAATGLAAIGLAIGWPARVEDPSPWLLAGVVGLAGATAMWIRSGRRGDAVERFGPFLLLAVVALAAAGTGGARSPYPALYLVLLVYAAAFMPTGRFAAMAAAVVAVRVGGLAGADDVALWSVGGLSLLTSLAVGVFLHVVVRRLDDAAQTDGLTGLWNHAAFWRRVHAEDARSRRSGTPYTVLMIDVDHFKALNDTHGHQAGDAVLRRIAEILANRVRGSDVLARYGGEEFAVLLPDTAQTTGAAVAEKLRRLLAVEGINVSVGVADNAQQRATADGVVAAADAALYDAKLSGRARVRTAPAVNVIELPAPRRAATRMRATR